MDSVEIMDIMVSDELNLREEIGIIIRLPDVHVLY